MTIAPLQELSETAASLKRTDHVSWTTLMETKLELLKVWRQKPVDTQRLSVLLRLYLRYSVMTAQASPGRYTTANLFELYVAEEASLYLQDIDLCAAVYINRAILAYTTGKPREALKQLNKVTRWKLAKPYWAYATSIWVSILLETNQAEVAAVFIERTKQLKIEQEARRRRFNDMLVAHRNGFPLRPFHLDHRDLVWP